MNDKYQRMNDFLIFFRDIVRENPNYDLNLDAIYHKLTKVYPEDEEKRLKKFFPKWMGHFASNPNCLTRLGGNEYFLHFISYDFKALSADNNLKVYIPLDEAHIERGAEEIFDFLSQQKISHASKIGSDLRYDDIVVRLIEPEDLGKLLDFVKHNQYLQEGLMEPIPFGFNYQGIALAIDGKLTFNGTVSMLIKLYILDRKENNKLDQVSVEDFKKFVQNYSQKTFSSSEGIKEFSITFKELDERNMKPSLCLNYKDVFELLLKTMDPNFSIQDYLEHYRKTTDLSIQTKKEQEIKDTISGRKKSTTEDYSIKEKKVILSIKDILQVMGKKYSPSSARFGIIKYVVSGDAGYLTREDNLRARIAESSFRSDIIEVLNIKQLDITTYLNIVSDVVINPEEIYLEQAVMETYKKYETKFQEGSSRTAGKDFAVGAILQLLQDGAFYGFTRDNDARKNLIDNVSVYSVDRIIREKLGVDLASELSDTEIETLAEQYVAGVLSNNQSKKR